MRPPNALPPLIWRPGEEPPERRMPDRRRPAPAPRVSGGRPAPEVEKSGRQILVADVEWAVRAVLTPMDMNPELVEELVDEVLAAAMLRATAATASARGLLDGSE